MKLFILSLAIMAFIACRQDEVPETRACQSLTQVPEWRTIDFKSHLTIQEPDGYRAGIGGIEGPIFTGINADTTIFLAYAYCGALSCVEYGPELIDTEQDTFTSIDALSQGTFLDHRIDICDGLSRIGMYYYNLEPRRVGCLFWLNNDVFRQALSTYFLFLCHPEHPAASVPTIR